ncbi:MAG: NifB/NifX family molybdenum-iron cluster-binding protein [Planctomycetes bacterium]|nr:NifB/NifX family molybdenum-iron cluster-binding protein [Planctomycetota bacterium]
MKIAITASGETLDSPVDPRFGRAKYFIVVDSETGDYRTVDNAQNLNAAQGAGIQAAENVVHLGAECVLTGNCGPKAFRAMQAAGVKIIIGVEGSVSGVLEKFKAGEYQTADASNVEGHWL